MPDKAKAKALIFVYMAGGPSHLETFDPKPLLNKLDGQKRPAEFGDVKYQNVNSRVAHSRLQADVQEVRQVGNRSLRPVPAPGRRSSTISASFAPCTATWWSIPPRSIR